MRDGGFGDRGGGGGRGGDRPRPTLKRLLAGLAVAPALFGAYRGQADSDEEAPRAVLLNDRSGRIKTRACELAGQGRDDAGAVAELVELTGRHRRDLQIAALACRQNARHREMRVDNLAHRLLQAAITGNPVSPAPAADLERIAALEHFTAQTHAEQFDQLASMEPALADLDAQLTASRRGPAVDHDSVQWARNPTAAQHDQVRQLRRQLDPLVGPRAAKDDPVLRSRTAAGFAQRHFLQIILAQPRNADE